LKNSDETNIYFFDLKFLEKKLGLLSRRFSVQEIDSELTRDAKNMLINKGVCGWILK
jgi:hypothetical protein